MYRETGLLRENLRNSCLQNRFYEVNYSTSKPVHFDGCETLEPSVSTYSNDAHGCNHAFLFPFHAEVKKKKKKKACPGQKKNLGLDPQHPWFFHRHIPSFVCRSIARSIIFCTTFSEVMVNPKAQVSPDM